VCLVRQLGGVSSTRTVERALALLSEVCTREEVTLLFVNFLHG